MGGGGASLSSSSLSIDAFASALAADFRLLLSDDILGDFIATVVRFFDEIFVCLDVVTRTVRFLRVVGFIFGSSSDDVTAIKAEALQCFNTKAG